MTNQQGAPEALQPIHRFEVVDCIDSKHVPAVIPNASGPWVRYEDHAAALCRLNAYCQELESQVIRDCMTHVQNPAEIEHVAGDVSKNWAETNMSTQQPAPATQQAGEALSDDLRDRLVAISEAVADQDDRAAQAMLREILKAPQADSQPAPANTRQIAECYGDCPTDPKTCANPCNFVGRAARAPADSVTAPAGGGVVGWLPVHFNGHGFYGGPLKTEAEANQYIAQVHQSDDSVTLIARPFAWATAMSTTSVRAEALRLAEALDLYATGDEHQRNIEDAAAELRRLHAAPPAQAADSVLEDAARWQALEACVIEINGGKDWMSIVLKDDAKPEHFLKGLLADKLAALAARKQGGAT